MNTLSLAPKSQSIASPSSRAQRTSSIPPSRCTPAEKVAMFEAAEAADQDYEDAKLVVHQQLMARSNVIKSIQEKLGSGPFRYKGEEVRIVCRDSVYFFRKLRSEEPDEIG